MNKSAIWSWLFPLLIILVFGLTTVWSTNPNLFISQIVYLLLGVLVFLLVSLLDRQTFRSFGIHIYIFCFLTLLLTYVVGTVSRGSLRWINIGPSRFQPSEFAKPLLIISLASFFENDKSKTLLGFIKKILLVTVPAILVLFQPDLGSSLIIVIVGLALIVASGTPAKYLITSAASILLVSPLALQLLHGYQRQRLESFLNPYSDPAHAGYNVIQATIAIGSGQFFGKGVRQGTQSHLRFLPERHTDFAFASFAEEFGFFGVIILLTCFLLLLNWLIKLLPQTNAFDKLVVLGTFWLFFAQIVINIGMNLGVLPVTGITLPFVSYGGSSLITSFLVLGLVYATTKSKNIAY